MVEILIKLNIEKSLYDLSQVEKYYFNFQEYQKNRPKYEPIGEDLKRLILMFGRKDILKTYTDKGK